MTEQTADAAFEAAWADAGIHGDETSKAAGYAGWMLRERHAVEYDETGPCRICHEPVGEASMGGTDVCPACDCGLCRYCRVRMNVVGEHIDGGRSLRQWREHMAWHRSQVANDGTGAAASGREEKR